MFPPPSAPDLPPGYEEIWQHLSEADAASPNRQVLAAELGIGTQTLQRLLVTGDVPRFRETSNPREISAWIRTVTRLARYFGRPPRSWIEGVGISWTEETARATEKARREPRPTHPAHRRDPLADIRRQATPTVRVGLLRYHHFAEPLASFGASFLEMYADRLVRSIDPTWRVAFVPSSIETLIDDLTSDEFRCHIVAALFDTVERRSRGLRFLPIPGWNIRHSAIAIRDRTTRRPLPVWQDVTDPWYRGARFIVLHQQAAHIHLQVQCGLPASAFHTLRQTHRRSDTAAIFLKTTERHPDEDVIYVNEEESCLRVMEKLNRRAGFAERYTVEEITGAPGECPSYPLSLAVRSDAREWGRLLTAAQEAELHGNAEVPTARLYAEVMARGARAHLPRDGTPPVAVRSTWSPTSFAGASMRFQRELVHHLVHALTRELEGGDAAARARQQARELVPAEWERFLPPSSAIPPARSVDPRCESCGSMLGTVPSGRRYCTRCGGGDDRLRSRPHVQAALTEWILEWQNGVTRSEARRRAAQVMGAMPAWVEEPNPDPD